MDRRKFIITTGAVAGVSMAGCSLLGGDGDTDSSESVAEAFLRAGFDGDTDRAEELLHPDSPFDPTENDNDGSGFDGSVNSLETSVENDDFTADDLGSVEGFGMTVTEDTVSGLEGDEDMELVRVSTELEFEEETFNVEYYVLAATDGDEWLVLDIGVGTAE